MIWTSWQVRDGFIALFTVLALLVFCLSMTFATVYLSIDGSQEGWMSARGEDALQFSEGCAEDALLLSIRDENYDGGSYEYMGGECSVDISKDGAVWTADVVGTKNGFTRSIRIVFDYVVGPPGSITLQSWLEG